MPNKGIAPPDLATTRGKFRLLAGDSVSVPLIPAETGFGDYTLFSDAEVDAYLTMAEDSVYRAVGWAYLQLANEAARQAESIKDYDLSVDSRQKAEQLRAQALSWLEQADLEDAAGDDGFQIVTTGTRLTRAEREIADWRAILDGDWPI